MTSPTKISGTINCLPSDLNLKITLTGGQSFRWKQQASTNSTEEWIGVMQGSLWILSQNDDQLHYTVYTNKEPIAVSNTTRAQSHCEQLLHNYFRLDIDLGQCYKEWKSAHDHFAQNANKFHAIRVLDQEPVENLISFICSQNNHINRISSMVEKLCTEYGEKICTHADVDYYAFPELEQLNVTQLESNLRGNKFGYRAAYIAKAVKTIIEKGGMPWFEQLKKLPYKEARRELISVPGIGPKVSDCICLMSLGHLDAVPVDTHIYKVAGLHYLPHLRKTKTVTSKAYEEVGDIFRKVYGPLAGWAQTVIFCADLDRFSEKSTNK